MDVLVAGGTGFIGTALCRELAESGHDVTALARNPTDAVVPPGVDVVAGDVTDPDSIAGAVQGRDAVVNLVSLSPLYQSPRGVSHESVHLGGTRTLVDAAEAADVDRFVQLSGLDAGPNGPTAFLRAKGRAEAVVREADLEWVIVRPSVVFGAQSEFLSFIGTVTFPYVTPLPAGGRTRFQPIWIGDLAPMLADCVLGDRAGETYELAGPEVLTLADVTRLYHASRGHPVWIVPVPKLLTTIGFALADPLPIVPFGRDQARSLDIDNTVTSNDVSAFDVEPADLGSLRSYLSDAGG